MIHFASHGKLGNEYQPTIYLDSSFSESNSLTLSSLYGQNINSDLVFLAACHSGQGLFDSGTGIMSIARAFLLARCSNVISSLWAINDHTSAEISTNFYELMKKGSHYDHAIAEAKRGYLESVSDDLLAHPHY